MRQPRAANGRFKCDPYYPRKVASTCGCAHGRVKPCPIAGKFKRHRDAGARLYRPRKDSPADLEGFRRELSGNLSEQAAIREALDYTRTKIRDAGSLRHRLSSTGKLQRGGSEGRRGITAPDRHGEDSEAGYRELLAERELLMKHARHLRNEAGALRDRLKRRRR